MFKKAKKKTMKTEKVKCAKAGCLFFACMASAIHAGTWPAGTTTSSDVAFGSSSARLASDTVTIPNEGVEAGTLAVWPATDATIGFEGGSITFGSSASVTLGDGETDFNVPIASAGGLAIVQEGSSFSFSDVEVYGGEKVTVLENADLDVLVPKYSRGSRKNVVNNTLSPFNLSRGTGWLEVQYQISAGGYLKVIKVRYEQSGSDVTGEILYGKYYDISSTQISLGTDTDSAEWSGKGGNYNTGRYEGNSTGINMAVFHHATPSKVHFRKPVTLASGGTLDVGVRVRVTLEESATKDVEDFSTSLSVSGDLTYAVATNFTFSSTVDGGGQYADCSLTFESADNASAEELDGVYSFEPETWFPSAWTLVFTNALLSSVTNITDGKMGGTGLGNNTDDNAKPASVLFFRNDGLRASFQLQRKDSTYCKAVLVEMRQGATGVELRAPKCGYVSASAVPEGCEGYDFETLGWIDNQNWAPRRNLYTAKAATFQFSRAPRGVKVTGTCASGFSYGSLNLVSSGTTAPFCNVENRLFAPSSAGGIINIYEGSALLTPKYGSATFGLGSGATMYIHPGGVYMSGGQSLPYGSQIVIDGGMIILNAWSSSDSRYNRGQDGQVYLNKAVFRNGARIAGAGIRCGINDVSPLWQVRGSSPSSVDNDIWLFAKSASDLATITNDVADVTGDSAPDFLVGGGFRRNDSYPKVSYVKTGAGTLRVGGACTYADPYTNLTDVAEGTMLYAANALSGAEQFRLSGGALAFADGTTNAVHTFDVSAAGGTLNVGTNAAFSVVNNASIEGLLDVTLGDGATFRIGTTACLTSEARKQIRVNGFKVVQNEQGYVTARKPRGIMMSFK